MEEYVTETVCGPKKQLSAAYRLCALDYQFSMNLFFSPEKGSPCVAQAGHKGSSYLSAPGTVGLYTVSSLCPLPRDSKVLYSHFFLEPGTL